MILMILSFTLVSCVTAYQRQAFTGGFSELQLGENIYKISFKGNALTSRERISDYALLRSAEVTLENGFKYFIILDSDNYSKTSISTRPTTSETTGSIGIMGSINTTTTTSGGGTSSTTKYRTANTIECFKEKPEKEGLIYDAEFLVKSIKGKYHIEN